VHDTRNISRPDEIRAFEHGHADIIRLTSGDVSCTTLEPDWRWSTDVKPIAGTEQCEIHHVGYVLSGQMRVEMEGEEEFELQAGDLFDIPPGHDAYVLGDEPCVLLDWAGATTYARPA
jgi:mannose-6-phosphate isomerase-like protein (cupin superfamily)